VAICWEQGGSEPLYACGKHAEELGRMSTSRPETAMPVSREAVGDGSEKAAGRMSTQPAAPAARRIEQADGGTGAEAQVATYGTIRSGGGGATTPLAASGKKASQPTNAAPVVADRYSGELPPLPEVMEPEAQTRVTVEPEIPPKTSHTARSDAAPGAGPVASEVPGGNARTAGPRRAGVGRASKEPAARLSVRDLTYGNPAKAMVDEAIWNLAPGDLEVYRAELNKGRPEAEAAQEAGGQFAVVHRKTAEYTGRLEGQLSDSKATISVAETIGKPLEQAMLAVIGDGLTEAEQDAAMQRLGAVEQWVTRGLNGSMTPLNASRLLRAIGGRVNWGGECDVPGRDKALYKALYESLSRAMESAAPDERALQERLANLYAAKDELESAAAKPMVSQLA